MASHRHIPSVGISQGIATHFSKWRPCMIRILRACIKARALAEGKQVHAQLRDGGYDKDKLVGNLLVQMYGICGSTENAIRVFLNLTGRDSFSWNIIVTAYAQNGHLHEARFMFDRMPQRDVVSWNSMLTAYAQHGQLQEARNILDKMLETNVVSWTAMITGYAQNGHSRESFQLFQAMDMEGVQPNEVTFISILESCDNPGLLVRGRMLHNEICDSGCFSDTVVATSLLNMYGKCRSMKNAKNVFDEMPKRNVVSWNAMISAYGQNGLLQDARKLLDSIPECNIASCNTLISAYAQNGHPEEARSIFSGTPQRNVVSWTAILTGYAQQGGVENLRAVFEKMPAANVVSWTLMIGAYAQKGHAEEALRLFQLMDLEGMQPNKITFIGVFEACSSLGKAKMIQSCFKESGLELDVVVATALITMYGKCGSPKEALETLRRTAHQSLALWNAMVAAYAHSGHGNEAIELFRTMQLEGFQPNNTTFVCILSACSHAGLASNGFHYLSSMKADYGIKPTSDHYVCTIDLLGRAGRVDQAEELVQQMPFEPDEVAWTSLLGVCTFR